MWSSAVEMQTSNVQQVSIAALIPRRSKLLVLRRSSKEVFLPGVFELPGGKVDFGESPTDGLVREVREETGLQAMAWELLDARSYMSKAGSQHNIELFYLTAVNESGEVRISDAHDEFRWVGAEEIDALGLSPNDPIRLIMARYFKRVLAWGEAHAGQ